MLGFGSTMARPTGFVPLWPRLLFAIWCGNLGIAAPVPAPAADSATGTTGPDAPAPLSTERMIEDIRHLSGPEFNGRQTGTVDDLHSARWVADRFAALGLRPAAPNPLHASIQQPWMMSSSVTVPTIAPPATLALVTGTTVVPLQVGPDFLPILDSPSVDLTAPVTFVGYGLADPARDYDDYRGVDVTGRVVMFVRGTPPWYPGSASHQTKVRLALQRGAAGFLTVTGPVLTAYEARRGVSTAPLAYYGDRETDERPSIPLPGAWISVTAADRILRDPAAGAASSLATLQNALNRDPQPQSRQTGVEARLQWEQSKRPGTLHNVVALLEGSDPSLRDETIVIGAHRDHFGTQAGLLFAGADDNASGTAVVLEVARALATSAGAPKRSLLFVSFSGEEQGLLGSRLYMARPARPLTHTMAMINIDHAGIGNERLTVGVTGLAKAVVQQAAASAGLADKLDVFGFFPGGDHVPFKEADIPTVAVVSGGAHPHFHQATDTLETIRPQVLLTTARYVLALAIRLANETDPTTPAR